jgi:hypothetical protein
VRRSDLSRELEEYKKLSAIGGAPWAGAATMTGNSTSFTSSPSVTFSNTSTSNVYNAAAVLRKGAIK